MRFVFQRFGRNRLELKNAIDIGEQTNSRLLRRFNKGFDLNEYHKRIRSEPKLSYGIVYDILMTLYCGTSNWGEKTVLQWRNIEFLIKMFDDMIFIHCIRDPRDVLSSWKKETIAPGLDYLDAIANCYDSMRYALINNDRFKNRYFILKFEDLVQRPFESVKKLCQENGLSFHDNMINDSLFKNKVSGERWHPNTAFDDGIVGISTKPVGRWKEHLSNEALLLCELVNGVHFEAFNYKRSMVVSKATIKDFYLAWIKLQQSPLAFEGILKVIHSGYGVQRYPLDPFDPSTWERDINKL